MGLNVLLADLGHNQLTVSSDVYPLGIANLASYATAYVGGGARLDVALFREPQELKVALDTLAPDIVALSSYSWNHRLSRNFAAYAKRRHPRVLTLLGGPNYPLDAPEQERFLREMPEIDVAVRGPTYEGERAFLNLVQRLVTGGGRRESVFEEPVAGSHWIDPKTGLFVRGQELERIRDLDEIPSPYLTGWMEPFFSTGYFPMMQLNRGCPFHCTFCNSSVPANSKIHAHSLENIQADLLHIARRCDKSTPLCLADDNFGMFPLDEEVADYIASLQEQYGWPQYIRTTTGKNRGERILRVMRKLQGRLPMTAAVQSLSPQVLVNIRRSNISLKTYEEIQREVQAQGMQSYGEMILCLPGETRQSFLDGLRDLIETGVKRVSAHQLMLLHGAPISSSDSRQRFGFGTRYRVVARDVGDYTGEPVIETEEMVVSTDTFSFQDYLDVRVVHLLLTVFYYEGNFDEAFQFARQHGIRPFDLIVRMQQLLPEAPQPIQRLVEDFARESQEELFETEQECLTWARDHFKELVAGELGGNLLSKYSMLGRFYLFREALEYLETVIKDTQGQAGCAQDGAGLRDLFRYMQAVTLHVPFLETMSQTAEGVLEHDVASWAASNYSRPLSAFRFPSPRAFTAEVDAHKREVLQQRISTFGEHPAGLGKFTRTMFARDLRRSVRFEEPSRQAHQDGVVSSCDASVGL